MEDKAQQYINIVKETVSYTTRADRAAVQAAIIEMRSIMGDIGYSEPKKFIWFDSPLAAKDYIDRNATITTNGSNWDKWNVKDGARPPFHCIWRFEYIVAVSMVMDKQGGRTGRFDSAAEVLLKTGIWYLFEGAAICVDNPKHIEIDENGFIIEIEYHDGTSYKAESKPIASKDMFDLGTPPTYSCTPYTASLPESEPIGTCITDDMLAVHMATTVKGFDNCRGSSSTDFLITNAQVYAVRTYGRRSMISLHAMSVTTVRGVLDTNNAMKGLGIIERIKN